MVGLNSLRAIDFSEQAADHFNNPDSAGKLFVPNGLEALSIGNTVGFDYASVDEAFPVVDPGETPCGNLVLFQIRQPKLRTAGGIIIDTETRKTEFYNTQVAKVIAIAPLAFHNRNTGDEWPEGAWAEVGSFCRIPKYQGERFTVNYTRDDFEIDPDTDRRTNTRTRDEVHFCLLKDLSILSITKNPLTVRAFL